MIQYKIALAMLALGVVLWAITYVINKASGSSSRFTDIEHLGEGAEPD